MRQRQLPRLTTEIIRELSDNYTEEERSLRIFQSLGGETDWSTRDRRNLEDLARGEVDQMSDLDSVGISGAAVVIQETHSGVLTDVGSEQPI